jgi:hypothetical protein
VSVGNAEWRARTLWLIADALDEVGLFPDLAQRARLVACDLFGVTPEAERSADDDGRERAS